MKISLLLCLILATSIFSQPKETVTVLNLEQDFKNTPSLNTSTNVSLFNPAEKMKKSAGLAIIYSLLLPGMGELYAGNYSSGKYFTMAEGVLLGTYIGMSIYAGNQQDNYKSYATTRASVQTVGKDEDYFATIGEYLSLEDYNDQKALERNFIEMYNSESYYWEWQSNADRKTYRNMWLASEQTYNDLRFVVGAMLLNRVASIINAVRLVASYNKSLEEELSWSVSMGIKSNPNLPTSVNLFFQTAL